MSLKNKRAFWLFNFCLYLLLEQQEKKTNFYVTFGKQNCKLSTMACRSIRYQNLAINCFLYYFIFTTYESDFYYDFSLSTFKKTTRYEHFFLNCIPARKNTFGITACQKSLILGNYSHIRKV